MDALFLRVVNLALTAGWLVLAVILLRPLLRRAPRSVRLVLWGMAALRLLLPIDIRSALSLIPSAEPLPAGLLTGQADAIESGIPYLNEAVNPVLAQYAAPYTEPQLSEAVSPVQLWTAAAAWVWAAGAALMLGYMLVSTLRLKRRVRTAIPVPGEPKVYRGDTVASPFILGVLRPRIYLPAGLSADEQAAVLHHERCHLRHGDHLWKPIGFVLLAVYWFHPLLWLGYGLFCRDIELACDERVIRTMEPAGRKQYSAALLACSTPRRIITACPLAFGEVGVKERIKAVFSYKKPALWVTLAAVLVCAVTAVCFLTNPRRNASALPDAENEQAEAAILSAHTRSNADVFPVCGAKILAEQQTAQGSEYFALAAVQEYALTDGKYQPGAFSCKPVCLRFETISGSTVPFLAGFYQPEASTASLYENTINTSFPDYRDYTPGDAETEALRRLCEKKAAALDMTGCRLTAEETHYSTQGSDAVRRATFTLRPNGRFTFSQSILSSRLWQGCYLLTDDRLTLVCEGGKQFVFLAKGEGFVFSAARSAEPAIKSGDYFAPYVTEDAAETASQLEQMVTGALRRSLYVRGRCKPTQFPFESHRLLTKDDDLLLLEVARQLYAVEDGKAVMQEESCGMVCIPYRTRTILDEGTERTVYELSQCLYEGGGEFSAEMAAHFPAVNSANAEPYRETLLAECTEQAARYFRQSADGSIPDFRCVAETRRYEIQRFGLHNVQFELRPDGTVWQSAAHPGEDERRGCCFISGSTLQMMLNDGTQNAWIIGENDVLTAMDGSGWTLSPMPD